MKTQNTHINIALALSGGGARCFAHIGALRAFEEAGIRIDAVAGADFGALVGALFAKGMSADEIEKLAKGTDWKSLYAYTICGPGVYYAGRAHGFLDGVFGDIDITELPKPLSVVCTDLATGEQAALTKGRLWKALIASCSVPVLFPPVEMDGRQLAGGSLSADLPVAAARALGARAVVAVNADHAAYAPREFLHAADAAIAVTRMLANASSAREEELADYLITVESSGFGPFDLERADEIVVLGYEAARPVAEELAVASKNKKKAAV